MNEPVWTDYKITKVGYRTYHILLDGVKKVFSGTLADCHAWLEFKSLGILSNLGDE